MAQAPSRAVTRPRVRPQTGHGLRLLSAILETGSVESLRKVDAGLFIDREVEVFNFVKRHYRRYAVLPSFTTVEEELRITLPEVDERLAYYLRRVLDRKLYGDVSPAFGALRDALQNNDMDSVRNSIETMKAFARLNSPDEDIRNLGQAMEGVYAAYDYAKVNPGISGVPTAWPGFDRQTGGYQAGDLVTWVARMSVGKTYLLMNQAIAAWESGFNVLVVTMEMTIEQITRRTAGMLSNVNPDYIRKGMLSTYSERRLRRVMSSLAHTDRFNLYAGGFSKKIDDIETVAHEFDPDIIFIDGIYLISPDNVGRNANRVEKVTGVLDSLKKMTITHNRPIITTTQFSRQSGKKGKEGSLENIAYTDAIGTHSSIVIGVKEGEGADGHKRRRIEFMKGREGEHGHIDINFVFTPMDFTEIPPPPPSTADAAQGTQAATEEETRRLNEDYTPEGYGHQD